MNMIQTKENGLMTIALNGRLDTVTAPSLESLVNGLEADVTNLVFDFAELKYLSSAGLRVLLKAQKAMNKKGSMKIMNVNEAIMEIFDITGFVDILTIE